MSQHLIEERLSDRSVLVIGQFLGFTLNHVGWRGAEAKAGAAGQAGQPRDGEDRA